MKKTFTTVMLSASLFSFAQDFQMEKAKKQFPLNEIKINVIYPFWGMAEISYERSLNEHSSIGASAFLDFSDTKNSFFFSPYYRYYFGNKPSQGFYLEGQIIFMNGKSNFFGTQSENVKMAYGIGIGAGYKHVFKNNWFFDATMSAGVFLNKGGKDYYRPGLIIGKRF